MVGSGNEKYPLIGDRLSMLDTRARVRQSLLVAHMDGEVCRKRFENLER